MPLQLKDFAFIAPLVFGLVLSAVTMPAQADERCSGTLCDLYYGKSSDDQAKPAAKPAAPTPIMVPSGGMLGYFSNSDTAQKGAPSGTPGAPAATSTPHVRVGGGGLAGLARGETSERCTGTLCDFYYGGPPPEKPDAPAAGTASAAEPLPDDAQPTADAMQDDSLQRSRRERVEFVEREPKPRCASTAQDPWRCYR